MLKRRKKINKLALLLNMFKNKALQDIEIFNFINKKVLNSSNKNKMLIHTIYNSDKQLKRIWIKLINSVIFLWMSLLILMKLDFKRNKFIKNLHLVSMK